MPRLFLILFFAALNSSLVKADDCKPQYPESNGFSIKDQNQLAIVKKIRQGTVETNISGSSIYLSMFTFGAVAKKANMIIKFPGENAKTVISNKSPVFYDIFVDAQTDPEDVLILAKFESKDGARYTALGNIETRINSKTTGMLPTKVKVVYTEISTSCQFQGRDSDFYSATPETPLDDGEYVFFYAKGKVPTGYDFSVKSSEPENNANKTIE